MLLQGWHHCLRILLSRFSAGESFTIADLYRAIPCPPVEVAAEHDLIWREIRSVRGNALRPPFAIREATCERQNGPIRPVLSADQVSDRDTGHGKPKQLSSTMAHDEKRKQALESQGRNHAQIDRRDGVGMVAQERPVCTANQIRTYL